MNLRKYLFKKQLFTTKLKVIKLAKKIGLKSSIDFNSENEYPRHVGCST